MKGQSVKPRVIIYSKDYCPYCLRAKDFFAQRNIAFEEIDVTKDVRTLEELKKRTGHLTVPQIFINDVFVGGYTDLMAKVNRSELVL